MVKSEKRGANKGQLSKADSRKFVDCHLSSASTLPRNVDRSMFGHGAGAVLDDKTRGEVHSHLALSEHFLSGFGVERSDRVLNWMDNLKAESERFIHARRDDLLEDELKATMYRSAVSYLVDKMFQDLRWFAHEYNKVAHGTPLQISSSILGEVTEVVRVNSKREAEETATFFRARLSNRRHSLVLRGGVNRIDFYVVPISQVMAMSLIETEYKPVATIGVRIGENGVNWKLMNNSFRPDTLDDLCMWMFGQFVDTTRSELGSGALS